MILNLQHLLCFVPAKKLQKFDVTVAELLLSPIITPRQLSRAAGMVASFALAASAVQCSALGQVIYTSAVFGADWHVVLGSSFTYGRRAEATLGMVANLHSCSSRWYPLVSADARCHFGVRCCC